MEKAKTAESEKSRRSTRIDYDVLVELKGERFAYAGHTSLVNLHGALIKTAARLDLGTQVTIYVHHTGKSASGRVVFASYDSLSHYGIDLEEPANIWGLTEAPPDWQEMVKKV